MSRTSEKLKELTSLIPDENLRHIIFNYNDVDNDTFLGDEKECLSYLQNMLTVTSAVILRAFLKWKKENLRTSEGELSSSMLRIYNILNRAYSPNKLTSEFIDNLMINLVIDHSLNQNEIISFSQTIGIWDMFKFPQTNNNFSKYIYMLKQSRISSRYQCSFGFENLCECIEMFTFLRTSTAKLDNIGTDVLPLYSITLNLSRRNSVNLGYSLFVAPYDYSYRAYYLFDLDFNDISTEDDITEREQKIKLEYICLDNSDSFNIFLSNSLEEAFETTDSYDAYIVKKVTAIEDFIIDYDIPILNEDNKNSHFFKDYFLINNRYIRELSLTVSDALTRKSKDHIVSHLTKYKAIFDKMHIVSFYGKDDVLGRRWDEIVLFLMLEKGIYEFLKFLLLHQEYRDFRVAFYNRFGRDRVNAICEQDPFLKNPEKEARLIQSKEGKLDYLANALITLATKLLSPDTINLTKNSFPISIDDAIEEMDEIYQSRKHNEEDKIFCLTNSTVVVLSFLTTFYSGVIKYAESKKSTLLSYEIGLDGRYIGTEEYVTAQERWIADFKSSIASVKRDRKSRIDPPKANLRSKNEAVKWLNNSFDDLISTGRRISKRGSAEAEILSYVTGRSTLFDEKIMLRYKSMIGKAVAEGNLNAFYTSVKGLMNYLKTGTDNNDAGVPARIENAIYPIVGQYFSTVNSSRDGYKFSWFKVDTYKNEIKDSVNVKMITDEVFDFGQSYYCVPNINRVADMAKEGNKARESIWISPIIIPCSLFLPNVNTEVEALSDSKDYESAIELIYESDPYIYGNLFGSLENAKKVFPELLNTRSCKFHKNNYLIVKDQGKVIAIAAMYKFDVGVWDTDVVLKAFGTAGVDIPETFGYAVKHIADVFNDTLGSSFNMIDDICVRSEYRNKGIGRSLIWYMVKEAEKNGTSLVLSTYAENGRAYNLYARLGFIPFSQNTSTEDGKDYFKMIRI